MARNLFLSFLSYKYQEETESKERLNESNFSYEIPHCEAVTNDKLDIGIIKCERESESE